jgi:hypothetical protein
MKAALIVSLLAFAGITGAADAAKTKPYPLKVCIVTDNELGSMGKPITKIYGDQEIKFCCKPCVKKFEKEPQKYLKKLGK